MLAASPFSIHIPFAMVFIIILHWGPIIVLFILAVKALIKYLRSGDARKETAAVRKSLGDTLRAHRIRCKMTQEFVAERLGVSRQAVSKWENGASDPSTSNLLALAKLYDVDAAALLKELQP